MFWAHQCMPAPFLAPAQPSVPRARLVPGAGLKLRRRSPTSLAPAREGVEALKASLALQQRQQQLVLRCQQLEQQQLALECQQQSQQQLPWQQWLQQKQAEACAW